MVTENTVQNLKLTDVIMALFKNNHMVVSSDVFEFGPCPPAKLITPPGDEELIALKFELNQVFIVVSAIPSAIVVGTSLFVKSRHHGELQISFVPDYLVNLDKLTPSSC